MRLRSIFVGYPRARLVLLIYATVVFVFNLWLWKSLLPNPLCPPPIKQKAALAKPKRPFP